MLAVVCHKYPFTRFGGQQYQLLGAFCVATVSGLPDYLAPCTRGFGFTLSKVFACKLGVLAAVPTHYNFPRFGNSGSRLVNQYCYYLIIYYILASSFFTVISFYIIFH